MKKLGDRGHQQIRMLLTFLAMLETPKKRYLFKTSPHPVGGNTNLRWFIVGPSVYRNLYPPPSFQGQIQNRNHILRRNTICKWFKVTFWSPEPRLQQGCCNALLRRLPRLAAFQSLPSAKKVRQKGWFSSDWGAHKIKSNCIVGDSDIFWRYSRIYDFPN